MDAYEIERLAELMRRLPPAPAGWVEAAKELPRARGELGRVVARVEADAEFRAALVADLESALQQAGYVAEPALVALLRTHLAGER